MKAPLLNRWIAIKWVTAQATAILLFFALSVYAFAIARPGVEYKIFQFPADKIPRIDGDPSDWSIVPESYSIGMDQLKETAEGPRLQIRQERPRRQGQSRLGQRPQPFVLPLRGLR